MHDYQFNWSDIGDIQLGRPNLGHKTDVAVYRLKGFIEGIFNVYTRQKFSVKEVDCWSTGERTCRFTINRSA